MQINLEPLNMKSRGGRKRGYHESLWPALTLAELAESTIECEFALLRFFSRKCDITIGSPVAGLRPPPRTNFSVPFRSETSSSGIQAAGCSTSSVPGERYAMSWLRRQHARYDEETSVRTGALTATARLSEQSTASSSADSTLGAPLPPGR